MPEISEVKLTAEFVTQANKNRTIENVSFLKTNKLKLIEEIDLTGKRISAQSRGCLLYTSPSPRDKRQSRMPSSA